MSTRPQRITTKDNYFQRLEVLKRNRKKRYEYKEFFVEGVRNINRMLEEQWPFAAVCSCQERRLSGWARDILKDSNAPTHYELSEDLFNELSGKNDPGELFAVAKAPSDDLNRIPLNDSSCVVVFDRPQSPGNLGTLLRSMDAFGADGLIITGHAADLYDPTTLQASVGSLFSVPAVRLGSPTELFLWIEKQRKNLPQLQVVGTSATAHAPIRHHDFLKPTLLLLGNEGAGLSRAYQDAADTTITIPMSGKASSLNVSCAASVILAEIHAQKNQLPN